MDNKMKICFIGDLSSSFVYDDFKILSKHFSVKSFKPEIKSKKAPRFFIGLIKEIKNSDIVFCWFADLHATYALFLSKIFGKKIVIVAGGYDVVCFPEINYGLFCKSLHRRILAKLTLKYSDVLLTVSEFAKKEILNKVKINHIKVIFNGVDVKSDKSFKKEKIITTAGSATVKKCKLKGLETFAVTSVFFPDYKFVIIGEYDEETEIKLKKINPELVFTGLISHEETIDLLKRSLIYCQLSYVESFGVANAEAMSVGCVPIVTNRGALREVVGDAGFIVNYNDVDETKKAINNALKDLKKLSDKAKNHISKNFNQELREKSLIRIINQIS